TLRIREPAIVPDILSAEFMKLADTLDRIADDIKDDKEKIELESASIRCTTIAGSIESWLKQSLPGQVYWIKNKPERDDRVELASAPIEVAEIFREKIFGRIPSVILTSATLSVGGSNGFDFFKDRYGF